MSIQLIQRKISKIIHVYDDGRIAVYSVCQEQNVGNSIRDTDMAEEMDDN